MRIQNVLVAGIAVLLLTGSQAKAQIVTTYDPGTYGYSYSTPYYQPYNYYSYSSYPGLYYSGPNFSIGIGNGGYYNWGYRPSYRWGYNNFYRSGYRGGFRSGGRGWRR